MAITTTTAITLSIAVASMAAAAASAAAQAKQAQSQARSAQEAAIANNERQQKELSRQQKEAAEQGREEKSDRIKAADSELSSLRAASGESGLTSTAFLGLANDIASREGIDVSRIDHNTDQMVDALQSQKDSVASGHTSNVVKANNTANSARQQATYTAIGSGLKIADGAYKDYRAEEVARNKTNRTSGTDYPF